MAELREAVGQQEHMPPKLTEGRQCALNFGLML